MEDCAPIDVVPLQRSRGRLVVSATATAGVSALKTLRQEGAYRALFPRTPDTSVEAVSLNTSGGIAGGDVYRITGAAQDGAHLVMTTQAAERVYKTPDELDGSLTVSLSVDAGSRLSWLPQETILFDEFGLRRSLRVDLTGDARFLMIEPLVFGRQASGEHVVRGRFHDHVRICKDGRPIYVDRVAMAGDLTKQLQRSAIGAGATAMANLVFCDPDAQAMLDPIRDRLGDTAGASLLADDLLVLRALAPDSFALRKTMVPILNLLTGNRLPKTWRL